MRGNNLISEDQVIEAKRFLDAVASQAMRAMRGG